MGIRVFFSLGILKSIIQQQQKRVKTAVKMVVDMVYLNETDGKERVVCKESNLLSEAKGCDLSCNQGWQPADYPGLKPSR